MSTAGRVRRISEFGTVVLTRTREADGRLLPEGARGAVVHIYHGGDAYEVEFIEPFHAVLTLARDDIRPE